MNTDVSAVITTYKRDANIVKRAIDSVLNQTIEIKEIIVVDDNKNGSEFSQQLSEMMKDMPSKVIYIKQTDGDGNKGACAARNLGIANASGNYIGFLDDDDWWLPSKIEKEMQAFEGDVGLVYCSGIIREETESGIKEYDYSDASTFKQRVTHHDMLLNDYVGSTSNPLIKKECFITCGGFDVEMPARQDYEMWIRISKYYGIKGINDKLFVHTLHYGEQISRNTHKVISGYCKLYEKHIEEYKQDDLARYIKLRQISKMSMGKDLRVFLRSVIAMESVRLKMLIKRKPVIPVK